jgi:next-to-BRCA1 protein 1
VTLDPTNQHVYKTLFRAAKAKLKLRLRATIPGEGNTSNNIPTLAPIGLPGAFASAFPEFARFGSETTLNTISTESTMPRTQGPTETLIPVANGSTETPKAEAPPQLAQPKRMSSRLSREGFFSELTNLSRQRELALRVKEPTVPATANCSWSVFCNACDKPMADAHYHCNICDDGDYDLCDVCVNAGIHCPGENHWLVKRFVKNGQVVSSTTERLSPKLQPQTAQAVTLPEMPGAYTEHVEEKKIEVEIEEPAYEATRTCNCCVRGRRQQCCSNRTLTNTYTEDQESRFVTCLDCPDYDLCIPCHESNNHGHHPAHKFKAVGKDVLLTPLAEFLCAPGRNTKHAALCDGCDKVSSDVHC